MSALYDPGLQPERTELAWRRTALALAVGSLVAMRMLPATLGGVGWVAPGIAGLVCAGALWHAARLRAARVNDVLLARTARRALPDGALLVALAALTGMIGVFGLVVILVAAMR
ncbi:MAG: DUF202 domain-containing protein [Microbacterium sp.]|uniref:DUF202 domain-containing protein n=1 Tax=Microbacterium sp. TaxID=51671 RepID=UPI001AD4A83B|nr:DUF202 domain-containing protein [Microbacterium sp.]MBN9178158.1 DUF202 domain-containing protein [Microbacterium sp.]